ncbi:double-strand break repair helicase AddA [Jannaschia sp. M317]|uniref:double-strand break repair helicase AddA n=1 Tax=Jannaschia sp. M317 TaxID=2867011 RepID=UPI0021A7EAED|nr:double-strand break repair helicase AddA [Jannaschia sp. M317]UWQ18516.1 double-strand break repair helicase AddA [Jannaschia sp. M317]
MTDSEATRAQIGAADPSGSVWLAANAGSGKTRVLTNRVAWLLLEGTPPERILCLTYTKAAAGEMQNRLFERLGTWAMLPDEALRAELRDLGVPPLRITSENLRHARTLFARAIEAPGGLKIQTIHAFCASLLRRFPLEAGVSPAFSEMDETATARLHAEILDEMASGADAHLVDAMSARLTEGEPSSFLAAVASAWRAGTVALDEAALRTALEVGCDTEDSLRDLATGPDMLDMIESFLGDAEGAPGKSIDDLRSTLQHARIADPHTRFDLLRKALLTDKSEPRKTGRWPKAVQAGDHGPLVELFTLMAERMADALARISALASLDFARTLHAFAPVFTARLQAAKEARGWLDFDDQIRRARHLLSTSDMAQWVLFKLDGGLDHILVDEAQDTAPDQWHVIKALATEFGAGQGARADVVRTLFVVGDRKQSIYSFQGADPEAFERMRDVFADRLPDTAARLRDHALLYSFRSSPVILDLVDRVFADGGGVGEAPEHRAFFDTIPGRVDLWQPILQEAANTSDRRWFDPIDRVASNDANVVLADRIADQVATMLQDGTPILHKGTRRPVQPGDILILLQRRGALFHHVIRACKARGLDLAGADRLKLSDDLAVRDLIALLRWAATPDDDLSLATVLRSPLGGRDEADLFALAQGRRKRPLWSVLRDSGQNVALFDDVLRVADILRPYEILQRILIRHDGRRTLLARLGVERDEAIEALLGQALAYEQLEVPSLAGFLGWLDSANVDLKRQASKGSIRVMSVHGSKGLESPVVILPETQKRKARGVTGVRRLPGDVPVWMPSKSGWSPALHRLSDQVIASDAAERDRLLYVALTRAESWLIVCAAGDVGEARTDSWWCQVEAGMTAAGAQDTGNGDLRLEAGDWSAVPVQPRKAGAKITPQLPDWAGQSVTAPAVGVKPIAPSALPGAKALPGDAGLTVEAAMARGTGIHLLLEHLPNLPRDRWDDAAGRIAPTLLPDAVAEATRVLDSPDLTEVFAPGTLAEVPFALPAQDGFPAVSGTMDRVIVTAERVTIIDFKSNAQTPDVPDKIPSGILAQMGAYRAAAQAIWPEREVTLAVLWTRTAELMAVPHDLVTGAWQALARH